MACLDILRSAVSQIRIRRITGKLDGCSKPGRNPGQEKTRTEPEWPGVGPSCHTHIHTPLKTLGTFAFSPAVVVIIIFRFNSHKHKKKFNLPSLLLELPAYSQDLFGVLKPLERLSASASLSHLPTCPLMVFLA